MDLASIIGIVGSFALVIWAILYGGSLGQFIDIPSIIIVFGGGFMATIIRFPLKGLLTAAGAGVKVGFMSKNINPRDMIEEIVRLAEIVRKSGPLGLENVDVSDPSLAKGAQYIADGYELDFIRDAMERERDMTLTRLTQGKRFYKALADSAPAFGMIGTLVGLVQMLASMDDPSAIGPAMAVALLTTLYGALVSNIICLPLCDKFDDKLETEEINQTLIIDGICQIRENKSPALIKEMLLAYLPESARASLADAA
ncbi:motility protein A [Pannonibacter tanglangensis]|uniref:Flagellar motor protein PomA n=1 Tax=Pannonibacter tanglangensis TaxID=2750084 RepID=A0ABW9ZN26_9HYPH|nr:MotA/TolQ/ExbB proton channel family protein [Pannonibacter sp. XCT-34]NBN65317.1 flagellar motor protein PomA [Pannonibacter sp. XCT-34]